MSSRANHSGERRGYTRGVHRFRAPNGVWYAYLPGPPAQRRSLGTRDESDAEIALRKLLRDSERLGQPVAEQSLFDIAKAWLAAPHGWTQRTRASARNRIKLAGKALERLGIEYPQQITAAALDSWIRLRRTQVSHRTINRDLRVLKRCIEWAVARSYSAPVRALEQREQLREARRTRRAVLPDPSEVARVIEALRERERGKYDRKRTATAAVCVQALYVTGLRCDELRRCTPSDLNQGRLWVRPEAGSADSIEPGKSWRERSIPLDETGQSVLAAYLEATRGRARSWSHSWLSKRLAAACKAAGVPPFGLHDLRRAAATEWHRAGIAIGVVAQWLGHAETATTELYLGAYRSDSSIVAPSPRGLLSLCNPGVTSGPLEAHANRVPETEISQQVPETTATNAASPGRVELPTNGLGNRRTKEKKQ